MITGIMLLGTMVGLSMIYVSYVYFRKGSMDRFMFLFWVAIWLGEIILGMFPNLFSFFNKVFFQVSRPLDLLYILGMLALLGLCFMLNLQIRKNYIMLCELEAKLK